MRKFYYILLAFITLCIMASCELEPSSDGNLYGFWHLESIDSIGGGAADLRDQLIFWGVQSNLIECSDRSDAHSPVIFRFERQDDSLHMGQAYYNLREQGDPEVTDVTRLHTYGIGALQPVFEIEKLKTDRLVLTDGVVRLLFKKF